MNERLDHVIEGGHWLKKMHSHKFALAKGNKSKEESWV